MLDTPEGFAAVVTFVWPFIAVGEVVDFQVPIALESFSAGVALAGAFVDVGRAVRFQEVTIGEGFPAGYAFVEDFFGGFWVFGRACDWGCDWGDSLH